MKMAHSELFFSGWVLIKIFVYYSVDCLSGHVPLRLSHCAYMYHTYMMYGTYPDSKDDFTNNAYRTFDTQDMFLVKLPIYYRVFRLIGNNIGSY
mgnify:CR=1 FL=1